MRFLPGGGHSGGRRIPGVLSEYLPHGRQLTHLSAHSTVELVPYERIQDPDRPALEERRYRRYIPGNPVVLRGPEYDGDPTQVRRRGRSEERRVGKECRSRWS